MFFQHNRVRFEHLNKFQALEDADDDERDHSTSTAIYVPVPREFPVATVAATVENKKAKMTKLSRGTQKERRREIHEINQATRYIMSKNEPLRNTAETSSPPPPTPSEETRPPRQSSQRTRLAPKNDCECCDGSRVDRPYASWDDFYADMRSG